MFRKSIKFGENHQIYMFLWKNTCVKKFAVKRRRLQKLAENEQEKSTTSTKLQSKTCRRKVQVSKKELQSLR